LELIAEDPSPENLAEANSEFVNLKANVRAMELQEMLSGPNDGANAIVNINAGAGGTEAQDWAQILLRMYLRFCEDKGFKTQIVDQTSGEEAGIKSTTFLCQGTNAYGLLSAEIGVHHGRLFIPMALARRPGERALAIDVFEDQHLNVDHSGKGDRARFEENVARTGAAPIDILKGELGLALGQIGCPRVADLSTRFVWNPPSGDRHDPDLAPARRDLPVGS
jgi:peptide chain release factor 2